MGLPAVKPDDLPHYTYDDYAQWEGRWEIINGIPYAMTPTPTMKHQRVNAMIIAQLVKLLNNCGKCRVYLPVDWQITPDTVVQPDVLVVCGDYEEGVKLTVPPVMVFEVLYPSTTRKDRGIKYRLYENAGVKYYCIVDPDNNCVEAFTLGSKGYGEKEAFKEGKMIFNLGECSIAFDFSQVFK